MGKYTQIILLLLIIAGTIFGVLYFLQSEGFVDVSGPLTGIAGEIPWVGKYFDHGSGLPYNELAELERLKEKTAREDRWLTLKKKEDKLRKDEQTLNEDRDRLSQWERELERREEALVLREKEFTNKEAQYEKAVKFYLSMRPVAAAKVLSQQDDLLVIELFRRMPERNVSAILAEMDPTVAGAIMRKMAR